jgi:hypothetical protein
MFKRLAMLVRGLMGCQSTAPSSLTAEQPSPNVKPLRAKSTQASPQVARSPASKKPKRKSSLAQAGTTAASRKPKQKPAQQMSGETGSQAVTPVSQPASPSRKRKPSVAQQTTQVKSRKPTPKLAQTISGKDGLQAVTPALPIQSPAPTKRKPKTEAAPSTSVARKLGKKKPTVRQVAMVSQSKPTGSKSKTAARPTRQHVK